jgi:uncharacterized protein (TIGR01319 family)
MFQLAGEGLKYVGRAVCPTTVSNLKNGFDKVRGLLDPNKTADRVMFTSSAKGGLAISAIGLVPDLTLKAAKSAAFSAGGKVVSVYSYKLIQVHIVEMAERKPDILLLAGGTDGGNEAYLRHNAEMLRQLPFLMDGKPLPALVYAGNAALKDEICAELANAGFDVYPAPNLLPQIDQMEPDGAREKIRDVFLRTIVHGKGLDAIQAEVGSDPMPTPLAVLALSEALRREEPDFGDFVLIDMGGATTDVYSAGGCTDSDARVILRGLPEPEIKRTVEGDLGMRVSASTAADSADATLSQLLEDGEKEDFAAFIAHLMKEPEYLPTSKKEARFDSYLASACIYNAMQRHAGTWRRVFTAAGETFLQQGKDLRNISKVIGTGGYLSALKDFAPFSVEAEMRTETISLIPQHYTYLRDYNYLFPLLGGLATEFPKQVARCAIASVSGSGEINRPAANLREAAGQINYQGANL